MPAGKLKMWNAERGFGFIADDGGGTDMFLHISALQSAGIDPDDLSKGDRLRFDVENTRRPEPATFAGPPLASLPRFNSACVNRKYSAPDLLRRLQMRALGRD